jgi:hypothetical protein
MTQSLCETCLNMRQIITPKRSRFLLCQLSTTNADYPNIRRSRLCGATVIRKGTLREKESANAARRRIVWQSIRQNSGLRWE